MNKSIRSLSSRVNAIDATDEMYLLQAVECAKKGVGNTFPNPIVGCVLVDENGRTIGEGFHPQSGFPHAEVFALLEAASHVESGVEAALSVVNKSEGIEQVQELASIYSSEDGQRKLFGGLFKDTPKVTAYVTLEPCSHTGRTPPCASALVVSQVHRVVVGVRDPNPRVDGGGVKALQEAGITVDLVDDFSLSSLQAACQSIVRNFCKRITPRPDEWPSEHFDELVTGSMRRSLRSLSGQRKAEGKLAQVEWGGIHLGDVESVQEVPLQPRWMEHVDQTLWENELVLLRLNKAVDKRNEAKALGEKIARELGAHVAQTLGHTCLLYRPGIPPVIHLS